MKEIAEKLEKLIQQDPGKRGLDSWAIKGDLLPATESLILGKHIIIASGFYILNAGEIETDGPPGSIILAEALMKSGKEVTLIFDDHSEKIMKEGQKAIGGNAELVGMPLTGFDASTLIRKDTTHFVALERPGRAADKGYYNFKGKDISKFHIPLDDLYTECASKDIVRIGIGDGGNELGMGKVSEAVDNFVPFDRPFSCKTDSDYTICAGVSNWAGYAIAALVSVIEGKNLMPSYAELTLLLEAIVKAGAVDGVSGLPEATVDGLEPSWEKNIYESAFKIVTSKIV